MGVKVKVPFSLLHLADGQSTVEVEGKNVGECLRYLQMKFPNIKSELFDKQGKLHDIFEVYLNRVAVYPEGLNHPVKDNDELIIIRIIAGG